MTVYFQKIFEKNVRFFLSEIKFIHSDRLFNKNGRHSNAVVELMPIFILINEKTITAMQVIIFIN